MTSSWLYNVPVAAYIALALLSICTIILITLYPFQFDHFNRIHFLPLYFQPVKFGGYHQCCTHLAYLEPAANVFLFIPFGLGLAGWLRTKKLSTAATFLSVLYISLAITFSVETLQVFIDGRESSLTDVLMNGIGGCLGFLILHTWWRHCKNKMYRIRRHI